jgi:hypothetical protein
VLLCNVVRGTPRRLRHATRGGCFAVVCGLRNIGKYRYFVFNPDHYFLSPGTAVHFPCIIRRSATGIPCRVKSSRSDLLKVLALNLKSLFRHYLFISDFIIPVESTFLSASDFGRVDLLEIALELGNHRFLSPAAATHYEASCIFFCIFAIIVSKSFHPAVCCCVGLIREVPNLRRARCRLPPTVC